MYDNLNSINYVGIHHTCLFIFTCGIFYWLTFAEATVLRNIRAANDCNAN